MDNKNKIILDLCGGTGSWSKPYKDAGYDVRLITLPIYDVTESKVGSFGIDFIKRTENAVETEFVPYEYVYGVLAVPPCTEFSIAKGNKPRNLRAALKVVNACMDIIQSCRLNGRLKFWAMENPRGLLRQFLGIPHFTFEHWEFGDEQIKPTDVWGYFNEPAKKIKVKPEKLTVKFGTRTNGRGWAKPECPEEYRHMNLNRAALRAITPKKYAEAFYRANAV
jgi:hypothetical protein